jgi:hypothetical protein
MALHNWPGVWLVVEVDGLEATFGVEAEAHPPMAAHRTATPKVAIRNMPCGPCAAARLHIEPAFHPHRHQSSKTAQHLVTPRSPENILGFPPRRMAGTPFGPFKHQALAIVGVTPRSFPKSQNGAMRELDRLMAEHLAEPFPAEIEKGRDYGHVDPVMIGADVYGWALRVSQEGKLDQIEEERIRIARSELWESLDLFPAEARPYYEHILAIADLVLAP